MRKDQEKKDNGQTGEKIMKEKVLRALRNTDGYVSGQELCGQLGVSRTSVWKAIQSLREDGYDIDAVKNRGYRVIGYPDSIAEEEIASRLHTKWMGKKICYFSRIDSTNQYAKRIGEEGAEDGTIVIADEQTAGKGRSGRHWVTPPKAAIAFTILLRPKLPPSRISMVTLVKGLAVCNAIRELYGLPVGIKWPNDVVIGGRKICGILTEMSAEMDGVHYIVIGTGINTNVTSFPDEIRDVATSLQIQLGHPVDRAEVLVKVIELFEQYYDIFVKDGDLRNLQETYNKELLNLNERVRVLDPKGEYTGTALGIDPEGQLLVKRDDDSRMVRVWSGEVSVRGIYGYV